MRPETPVPLTLEEHRELGQELRRTQARLRQLCHLMLSVYGPNNRAAVTFLQVAETMDRLCGDLLAQATVDLPGSPTDHLYTRQTR